MKISQLFGIKFARKYKYKAQIIADFKRWKMEKQYFLADARNKYKMFDRILRKYIEEHPRDSRNYEDIATELWEKIQVEVARTDWQQVYETVLGSDIELPNQQTSPHISRKDTKELFRDYNCKHYYFTDSAIEECEKVHITEIDLEWLRDIEDGKRQLNWGDQFIRFEKKDDRIIAIAASLTLRQEGKYLQHTFFAFDLNTPKLRFDPIADIIKEQCEKDLNNYSKEFENMMRMLLYKMVTFLDLIPLKQIRLPGWGCLESDDETLNEAKHVEPVYNNENTDITVVTVNANWNCSIYIEETRVRGYYKNTLCGKGKSKIIRRFVRSHKRRGHERVAGKLKAANKTYASDTNKVVKPQQKSMGAAANADEQVDKFRAKLAELKKKFNAS